MADAGTINLKPSVPSLDGTHLNDLIDLYIQACRLRLDYQNTVDSYEYQLRWFVTWWETDGPTRGWLLHPDDFARFEKYLRSAISPRTRRRLTYHTRATIIKRLREVLKWAQDKGYVERDYRKWISNADGGPPARKAASVAALHRLLDAVGSMGWSPLRDSALVAMLIGMGLRRAEVASIDIEGIVIETDHSGYARVVGKRTKANATGERDAAFDSTTGKVLATYLDSLDRTSGPLFVNRYGVRLGTSGIYKMVKSAIAKAGLTKEIQACHDLRRAFATHFARTNRGARSADILRRQLGHSSYSQTADYTLLDVDDLRQNMTGPLSEYVTHTTGVDAIQP